MSSPPFRRMVVRYRQGGGPRGGPLRLIAKMASAWRVELVGAFAPDPNLGRIAGHPATREFRLQERSWSSIEHATITSQLDRMTREYERSFAHALQSVDVHGWFASDVSAAAGDLLVVCEPDNPLEQLSCSFRDEIGTALAAGNAVIVVPRRVARSHGPIMVLAQGPDDPLRATGAELAAALGERLLSIDMPVADDFQGLPARLEPLAPGLLLVPRRLLDEQAEKLRWLASACRIPVLVAASEAE